ncbi:hypothetical protein BFQ30_09005 [Haemophilus quentini]|uniref:Uncharacterized protein n=1 Tax=Haemophilus quentini TaxID=123834 RepID=A0ABX3BNT7_9PAST|nr:hypothetical protein [Haemophilus quentini]EGT81114.1 Hypothetical protein GGE_1300 [Haemophilus haemolyticus M21639]OEY76125.1 hypothetical protein BFQ30_09005 [Haemophilus quentini]OEY76614.1 hypothetical protein BFQ29_07010 [Haemophilus quentini]ORC34182.1 hypothetical protein BES36_009495 [Haemophilus quentini]
MTDCKDCTTEQGRKDLINTPISITYSKAQFPHLTVTSEDWGINAVLWLEVGDFLPLGIDADTMQEALIMVAFLQQSTKAPLLINEEMQQELTALSENSIAFNPMKKANGALIPLAEILSTDTKQETMRHLEQQFCQDEKLTFTEMGGMLN